MIAAILITIAGIALVCGQVPFAKKAGRIAVGVILIATVLPCLIGAIGSVSGPDGSRTASWSDTLASAGIVVLILLALALIGRWAFKRWLAAKPVPPIPASTRRRVELAPLPERGCDDDEEEYR